MVTKKQLKAALKNRNEAVEILEELNILKDRSIAHFEETVYDNVRKMAQQSGAIEERNKTIRELYEEINLKNIAITNKDSEMLNMKNSINAKDMLIESQGTRLAKLGETPDSNNPTYEELMEAKNALAVYNEDLWKRNGVLAKRNAELDNIKVESSKMIAEMSDRIDKLVETLDTYRRPNTGSGGIATTTNAKSDIFVSGPQFAAIQEAINKAQGTLNVNETGDYPLFGGLRKQAGDSVKRVLDDMAENAKAPTYEEITANCEECNDKNTEGCPYYEAPKFTKTMSFDDPTADLHDEAIEAIFAEEAKEDEEAADAREIGEFAPEDRPKRPRKAYKKPKTTEFVKEN